MYSFGCDDDDGTGLMAVDFTCSVLAVISN